MVTLSRQRLAPLVPGLEDAFMRPVPKDTEALQLLTRCVRLFDDHQSLASPELCRLVVAHVYDLVALALGATRDAAAIANGRGVRAARLHAIKTEILNSLNRHELSLASLAARHGVTPRHAQMLFESDGTTFSRFLLDQRLGRAHRMLSNSLLAERTISAIAYEADLVRNDQVMLRIDHGLHIVADQPVSLPLVAMDRASGSVREICLFGAACTATSRALYLRIWSLRDAILSFSRADLASANSPS
jgi:AraC-like DNA-binding protein